MWQYFQSDTALPLLRHSHRRAPTHIHTHHTHTQWMWLTCTTVMTYKRLPTASVNAAELNSSFFQVRKLMWGQFSSTTAGEDIIVIHFLWSYTTIWFLTNMFRLSEFAVWSLIVWEHLLDSPHEWSWLFKLQNVRVWKINWHRSTDACLALLHRNWFAKVISLASGHVVWVKRTGVERQILP